MAIQKINTASSIVPVYPQTHEIQPVDLPSVNDETARVLPTIHRWTVAGAVVSLLRNGDNLDYLLINEDGTQIQGPIPRPSSVSLEQCIHFLTNCEPIISKDVVNFAPLLHKWIWEDYEIKLLKGSSLVDDDYPSDLVPQAEGKAGKMTAKEIARYLWLNPEAVISEEMVAKVNAVSLHFKKYKCELRGVKCDAQSFYRAYLKSYETQTRKVQAIEAQDAPVCFLENQMASLYASMPDELKAIAASQSFSRDYWLADLFPIPIVAFTAQRVEDHYKVGFSWHGEKSGLERVDILKDCIVIVDLGGHYLTVQPFSNSKTHLPQNLIWQLCNHKTQKTKLLSFERMGLFYVKDRVMESLGPGHLGYFPSETVKLDSTFSDDQLEILKNSEILKVVDKEDGSLENPKSIYLKPLTLYSQFDQKTAINSETWAVTLINTGRYQCTNVKTWYGHAGIMIEGVIDGAYYSCFTDLIAKDGGTVRLKEGVEPLYSEKTITRSMNRTKVERMILKIKEEIARQEMGERAVFFCADGIDSWLSIPNAFLHSTSPLSHLKIIKTFDSYEEMIQGILHCELSTMDPFIWDLDQNDELFHEMLMFETKFGIKKADTSEIDKEYVVKNKEVELEIREILNELPAKKSAKPPYQSVLLRDKSNRVWIESNNPREGNLDFQKYTQRFALELKNGGWVELAAPFNCLSWAKRKLALAGMDLKQDLSDWLLKKPSAYIKEGIGGVSNPARREYNFELESLRAPAHVRKKALVMDCLYLEELKLAKAQSTSLPPKPSKTLEALMPKTIDSYALLWLASLHDTPGITAEVHAFLIKLRAIEHKTSIHLALILACRYGRINEARTLLIYFLDFVDDLSTLIDNLISFSTRDDIATTFLDMLIHHGIDFSKTKFYQKGDEWRNTLKVHMFKKGHFNFEARVDLLYQLIKKGYEIQVGEGVPFQFKQGSEFEKRKEEPRVMPTQKEGREIQIDEETKFQMGQAGITLFNLPKKKEEEEEEENCVIS